MFKVFQESKSDEINRWDQLEAHHVFPVHKFINNIDLNEAQINKYAVVTDTEIKIHNLESVSGKPFNAGHFKDASSVKFRSDGNMILVGTKSGKILLLTTKLSGKILKSIQAHKGEITRIEYLHKSDPVQKLSVSIGDDGTLQIWDVVASQLIHLFANSKEPLRSLALTKSNPDLIATGSLDGFIRVYDLSINTTSAILEFDTENQVNCLTFPFEISSEFLLSAGKSCLSMWNIAKLRFTKDEKPVPDNTACPHHMQITDICPVDGLANKERVVFSVGLDGLVKVTSLVDFNEIAKYEYPMSLMSVRVVPNCRYLIVAGNDLSNNGKCSIFTRKFQTPVPDKEITKIQAIKEVENMKIFEITKKFCDKGEKLTVIPQIKKPKPTIYENLLRKHKHRALLNAMMNDRELEKKPELFIHLIGELSNNGALKRTIAEQCDTKLNILFRHLRNCCRYPKYLNRCINLVQMITDVYPISILSRQLEYVKFKKALSVIIKKFRKIEQFKLEMKDIILSSELSQFSTSDDEEPYQMDVEEDDE